MKNITTEKAIDLLQSKINELDDVGSPDEFLSWQNSAIQRLQVICPESPIIKQLSDIRPIQSGTSIVNKVKPHLKNMLISLVEDIEIVGIAESNKDLAMRYLKRYNLSDILSADHLQLNDFLLA